jgi:hypothetical protein
VNVSVLKAIGCGIVESILNWVKFKAQIQLNKKCSAVKHTKIKGIPKLDDANDAGTHLTLFSITTAYHGCFLFTPTMLDRIVSFLKKPTKQFLIEYFGYFKFVAF